MRWYTLFLINLGVIAVTLLLSLLTALPIFLLPLIGTAVWAAMDASSIRYEDYAAVLEGKPGFIGVLVFFLWILGFPYYLWAREQIMTGKTPRKAD